MTDTGKTTNNFRSGESGINAIPRDTGITTNG